MTGDGTQRLPDSPVRRAASPVMMVGLRGRSDGVATAWTSPTRRGERVLLRPLGRGTPTTCGLIDRRTCKTPRHAASPAPITRSRTRKSRRIARPVRTRPTASPSPSPILATRRGWVPLFSPTMMSRRRGLRLLSRNGSRLLLSATRRWYNECEVTHGISRNGAPMRCLWRGVCPTVT
jgi:hypothetical protein